MTFIKSVKHVLLKNHLLLKEELQDQNSGGSHCSFTLHVLF